METLKDALEVISSHSLPARVIVTSSGTAYITEVETASAILAADDEVPLWVTELGHSTSWAGISLSITPAPDRTRFAWSVPFTESTGQPVPPE